MNQHYNYILTGAGCAGLSLLKRMMDNSFFQDKTILVLDAVEKNVNDRTWCFWEKEAGLFESLVFHRWNTFQFKSTGNNIEALFDPYTYKMIRGIDFYDSILKEAKQFKNIQFKYEKVFSVGYDKNLGLAKSEKGNYTCDYLFNSILFEPVEMSLGKNDHLLLQHFKGKIIQTKHPVFDISKATFMDFTVGQENGTTFMYVLPISSQVALVEYTLFNKVVLEKEVYDKAIDIYVSNNLGIDSYSCLHEEFGIIPMTDKPFVLKDGRVINIGIAGGLAKGSSGFAFQFIQRRTNQLIKLLINDKLDTLQLSNTEKRFAFYDRVLLKVLYEERMTGEKVFTDIFLKNPLQLVLKYLDNSSNLFEDLRIMNSVSKITFLKAALQSLLDIMNI